MGVWTPPPGSMQVSFHLHQVRRPPPPTNASARTINERELGKLNGAAVSIEAIITGNVPLNKWNISVPSVLRLKVGAKVIFMKNKKPFWINGDLGIVTDILDNSIQVRKLASDNIVSVDKEIWEKFNYEYNYLLERHQLKS